ncbi:MAG: hypothetical protein K6T78_12210 [Alicyclobacillus sp.]|nr:hypothetical protein [Alicyclobacillus sp.]
MPKRATAPVRSYVVVRRVKHDGSWLEAGTSVDMPSDQGDALIRIGALMESAQPAQTEQQEG